MDEPQFPVFVRTKDCGEIVSHRSIVDMRRYFEPIDVENGEYEAWDSKATPVQLSVRESTEWLQLQPSPQLKPEQLTSAILEFARLNDIEIDLPELQRGDFSGALERVRTAILAKGRARSWWRRLRRPL